MAKWSTVEKSTKKQEDILSTLPQKITTLSNKGLHGRGRPWIYGHEHP